MFPLDDLLALWIMAKSFTEAAGTFGPGDIGTDVGKFVHTEDDGLRDTVEAVKIALIAADSNSALTTILQDMEENIVPRVLTKNHFDGSKYESGTFDISTTFEDMENHLIGLNIPPLPSGVSDIHPLAGQNNE